MLTKIIDCRYTFGAHPWRKKGKQQTGEIALKKRWPCSFRTRAHFWGDWRRSIATPPSDSSASRMIWLRYFGSFRNTADCLNNYRKPCETRSVSSGKAEPLIPGSRNQLNHHRRSIAQHFRGARL